MGSSVRFEELLHSAKRQVEVLSGIVDCLAQEHATYLAFKTSTNGNGFDECPWAVVSEPEVPHHLSVRHSKHSGVSHLLPFGVELSNVTPSSMARKDGAAGLKSIHFVSNVAKPMKCASKPLLVTQDLPSAPRSPSSTPSQSSEVPEDRDLSEEFAKACISGSENEVDELLLQRADPNMVIPEFQCLGKSWFDGSPLAIAVLRGKLSLVSRLLDARADPDSKYGFKAGAEMFHWSGAAINAAIPSGGLDMIKVLVEHRADLSSLSTTGGGFLWVAAYMGQLEIVEYLVALRADLEVQGRSQDDLSLSYSPLHIATLVGNCAVVEYLLKARACLDVTCCNGIQPLEDALFQGHVDITKLLIQWNADLFRTIGFKFQGLHSQTFVSEEVVAAKSSSSKWHGLRCIDVLFARKNHVLAAAVADAMHADPRQLQQLTQQDLVRFLRTPGSASLKILNSIFQPYQIKYWSDRLSVANKMHRVNVTASFMHDRNLNVAVGPHWRRLSKLLDMKEVLPDKSRAFMDRLAPQDSHAGCASFSPVTTYMCLVPSMQRDLEVLLAIADNPFDAIFNEVSCQAIIGSVWRENRDAAKARMVLSFLEVFSLFVIVFLANEPEVNAFVLDVAAVSAAALVWLVVVFLEVIQLLGYAHHGLLRRYFTSANQWWDISVIVLTGVVVWQANQWWDISVSSTLGNKSTEYRTVLGFIVGVKWVRMLQALATIESIGTHILPIIGTMYDIGPFCAVLGVYMIGACSSFYALGILNFQESFLVVYQLAVLGEADLEAMDSAGTLETYWIVRAMMIVISFVMGLTMMNLFIAMLCISYSGAISRATSSLLQTRMHAILDLQATRVGFRSICCMRIGLDDAAMSSSFKKIFQPEKLSDSYLWFACPRTL